jgi:hypothetical protein
MKTRSPLLIAVVILVSLSISIPPEIIGQTAQKAGEVSRAIPDVSLSRGSQQMPAPVKTLVDWGDVVRTGDGGRARVSLDDGSLLNVGSRSSLTVTQHDAKAQQSQIELEYGRVRTQVVKQTKPNAKFEVHTAVGVAGVVGGDAVIIFLNNMMSAVVYEGSVNLCNLSGQCVTVGAGFTSTIRGGNQSPDSPTQGTPSEVTDAVNATSVGTVTANVPVNPVNPWVVVGLTVLVAIPAIVIPLALRGKPASATTGNVGVACTSGVTVGCIP